MERGGGALRYAHRWPALLICWILVLRVIAVLLSCPVELALHSLRQHALREA